MSQIYLFDASSVVELLLSDHDITLAFDEVALDLTFYEAANALWKLGVAQDQFTEARLNTAIELLARLESELEIKNSTGSQLPAVIEHATEHGLTVYDAAYLSTVDRHSLTLVTEDSALQTAVADRDRSVTSIEKLS